jgi:hypothetical protein
MRNKLIFCVLFVTAILLFAAVAGSSDRRDRAGDTVGYNVLAERVFEGSVQSKPYTIERIVYFSLRTADSMVQVQIGPKEFVERSNFKITVGDMVTVTGMPVVMNGRDVVLARQVSSTNGVLTVRDAMGLPLWEHDGPFQMDPERQMRRWEISQS